MNKIFPLFLISFFVMLYCLKFQIGTKKVTLKVIPYLGTYQCNNNRAVFVGYDSSYQEYLLK